MERAIVLLIFLMYFIFPFLIGSMWVLLYLFGFPILMFFALPCWFFWLPLLLIYPIVVHSYRKLAFYKVHWVVIRLETPTVLRKKIWRVSTVLTILLWGMFLLYSDLNSLFVKTQNVPVTIVILVVWGFLIDLYFYYYIRCICYYLLFPFFLKQEKKRNASIGKVFIIKTQNSGKYKSTSLTYCFHFVGDKNIYKTNWIYFKKLLIEQGSLYQYSLYEGPYGIPYLKRGIYIQKEITDEMKEVNNEKYAISQANQYKKEAILMLLISIISMILLVVIIYIYKLQTNSFLSSILLIVSFLCFLRFTIMSGKHKTKRIPVINSFDVK